MKPAERNTGNPTPVSHRCVTRRVVNTRECALGCRLNLFQPVCPSRAASQTTTLRTLNFVTSITHYGAAPVDWCHHRTTQGTSCVKQNCWWGDARQGLVQRGV